MRKLCAVFIVIAFMLSNLIPQDIAFAGGSNLKLRYKPVAIRYMNEFMENGVEANILLPTNAPIPTPEPTSLPVEEVVATLTPEPTPLPVEEVVTTPTPEPTPLPVEEVPTTPTPEPTLIEDIIPLLQQAPIPSGNGIGLKGEYFDGIDFASIKTIRTDSTVNFDWGGGAPEGVADSNAFTVRWTGKVEPRFTETYTFYTQTHGGVRLWIDGNLLIDDWLAQNMSEKSASIELTAGQKYDIKMEYCEDKGSASAGLLWSSANQAIEIIPQSQLYPPFIPDIPANITATPTSTTVNIMWDAVSGAEAYDVEVDGEIVDNGANVNYVHEGLMSGSVHTYRVRAKVSGVVGNWSDSLTAKTKIGMPASVNAVVADDKITLTWNTVNGATGYDVEVDAIEIDNGTNTTYIHSGLMPNTQHTYRVRAKDENGVSDWSALITKTAMPTIPTVNVVATSTSITLAWDEITEVVGYDVSVDGSILDNGTSTTYIHNGLTPNTQHTYKVRARKLGGTGEWSAEVIKSTLPMPGSGIGLRAEYFDSSNLTDLKLKRIDDNVNFDWKKSSPIPNIQGDDFSIRWTGQVEARFSEVYTFHTETHGGIRLWVDNKLLIDDSDEHNQAHRYGTISLAAGKRYNIRMEYYESNGVSRAELYWSSVSQSEEIIPKSQLYPIGVPQNITPTVSNKSISLNWDATTNAVGYDIEVDGVVIDNGMSTSYIHNGLIPGTQHTYRARARGDIVTGEWSCTITQITLLGSPTGVTFLDTTETLMILAWDSVEGAVSYDVLADGVIINNGTNTTYMHEGIMPGTLHSYKVRARSAVIAGDWSPVGTKWTLPDVPQNLQATSTSTSITVNWNLVIGATGYDIELYGEPVDNGANTTYTHNGLSSNMQKTYRVRAKNSSGVGKWSPIIAKSTLSAAPVNVSATATDISVTVTWDAIAGAIGYDIEVDGQVVGNIELPFYLHSGLSPNTNHTYRVRSRSEGGVSEWSQAVTTTTLPPAPTNLSAIVTSSEIAVTWNAVAGATGYDVEVDGRIVNNISDTCYLHEGLKPNTYHTYKVRARCSGTTSAWSTSIIKITLPSIPTNLNATATNSEITVRWDIVVGATGYDIEVDGKVVDNGLSTTYVHRGLTPNVEHTYRVRSRNAGGTGEWSEAVTKSTLLGIPTNLTAIVTSNKITVKWDAVPGAVGYDVIADGVVVDNGITNTYVHTGLKPNTLHVYRVRAKANGTAGAWSTTLTKYTALAAPANIKIQAQSTKITVKWDVVSGAKSYEIEVDGNVISSGTATSYTHSGLSPNSTYKYRVRAKNDRGESDWSEIVTALTSPVAPKNIKTEAKTDSITITWDSSEGATVYDIEVDEMVMEDIQATSYTHEGLEPNTRHAYRIRAKDGDRISEWSDLMEKNTTPEVAVDVGKDNMFNFVVVVPAKEGVSNRSIIVTYNSDELEVADLCAVTPKVDIEAGKIEGTTITVAEFVPGKITYSVDNADRTVVNSIKFRCKTNENSKVTYTVE